MLNANLDGKLAIVCGSSQGLGAASAHALAAMGARVVCVARNDVQLSGIVSQLPGKDHAFITCDFSSSSDVDSLAARIQEMQVDILVNNAGGPSPSPVESAQRDEYLDAFQVHLLTSMTLTNSVLKGMKERGCGRIINIVSVSGKTPVANLAVSNTVRGAVINWAKTLSNEVASLGITVNNVLPGYTRTSRLEALNANAANRTGRTIEQVEAGIIAQIPVGRFGKPEEVAAAVAFFATESASFITGTSLAVDGGWSKFS